MRTYLIHPRLTIGTIHEANKFYEVCGDVLSQHVEVVEIKNEMVLSSAKPTKEDIIVFFNRDDQNYSKPFITLLQGLPEVKNKTEISRDVIPIALSKEMRFPPKIVESVQSFDVIDELRRRSLDKEYLPLIATTIARTIITRLQPTLSKDNMKLFLSHRRLDGENIAADFCKAFRVRAENVFRDLIDIRVGDDAQEIIEANLRASDAVIFIDTPKAGESEWIDKELSIALSLNLPIVWVKIGTDESRIPIKARPAENPHFVISSIETLEKEIAPSLIDDIIHTAFNITREYAQTVFDQMIRLKQIAAENGIGIDMIDQRNMIYQISIPRKGFKYVQKPMTHFLQFMGRAPKESDLDSFIPFIEQLGYAHPIIGPVYDTPILLAPIPGQICEEGGKCVVDSYDEYINNIQNLFKVHNRETIQDKGIIISGAFPDCEPEHQQHLTNAIYSFSEAIFNKSSKLIFGAHPTFQHLIFDMGKRKNPSNYKENIHLYISKYFVTDATINGYSKDSTVFATEVVEGERKKSLSLMRQKMITDPSAKALIALGGKTNRGGHFPGVDEEIELARKAGLPVFIIGSVGGRTAEIASEFKRNNWAGIPNSLSSKDNEEIMMSRDYGSIANKILAHLNI